MRIPLLIAALAVACSSAFPQGKVTFGNDSLHPIMFVDCSDCRLISASGVDFSPYVGLPVPQLGTANDQMKHFTAQLWAGTSSSSLSLAISLPAGQVGFADGRLANKWINLTGIAAGSPAFFQVRIFETSGGNFYSAMVNGYLVGDSPLFQATPGYFVPNSIVLEGGPGFSTWAPGPIVLGGIPEPSTASLLGLGGVALMLSRGRKTGPWKHGSNFLTRLKMISLLTL